MSEKFGKHLKVIRVGKTNLSQQQVAKLLNLDRSSISYYERGKAEPSIATLKQMGKIYGVSMNTLLIYEKNEYI